VKPEEETNFLLHKAGIGGQIANPQTLGLIPLSQIRKSLGCASPQIANPQIFMINLQIAN
jgi:hypothetical protein